MTETDSAPPKRYAKGEAKRAEILGVALDMLASSAYDKVSVREIARQVGLTQAGLLHYFTSKEDLFFGILRERELREETEYDTERDIVTSLLASMDHNARVPGLVRLYLTLAVEAADESYVAHEYFQARYDRVRRLLSDALAVLGDDGQLRSGLDADTAARVVMAVADGIQIQWMLDSTVDMRSIVEAAFAAVTR